MVLVPRLRTFPSRQPEQRKKHNNGIHQFTHSAAHYTENPFLSMQSTQSVFLTSHNPHRGFERDMRRSY
jgi:hypothetical protein